MSDETKDNGATMLRNIVVASRNEYKSRASVVALLSEARLAAVDTFDIRNAYMRGNLMAALMISEPEAGRVLILKVNDKSNPNGDDNHRTAGQERAYGNARQAWSKAMGLAGFPKSKAKARKARTPVVEAPKASITLPSLVIPKTSNGVGVLQFAAILSATMGKFIAKNSAAFKGDDCAAVRDAMIAYQSAIKAATPAVETPHTTVHGLSERTGRGH